VIGRYQAKAITEIWDEEAIFRRWTRVEIAACQAFAARGAINSTELAAIEAGHHQSAARVREIEKVTDHDVVAFVRAMSETVGEPASRHLHRGLTSSDVVDTGLALAMVESLEAVTTAARELKDVLGKRAREFKLVPCAGRTHGVHAEPTTFGVRLLGFYCEIDRNLERLTTAQKQAAYGKVSGAVGTFSQTDPAFEAFVLGRLGLAPEPVATQVVPRDRHAVVMTTLAVLGGSIERLATDIRAMQRTEVREAEEPFKQGQTGSSAMPHKKNPITSERLCGMARLLRGYAVAALEDIALWHERDISHSSVERIAFPDAFHLAHYMLTQMTRLIAGLRVYPERMQKNLEATGGLVFSQSALGALLAKGMERQAAYALVQAAAMRVWDGKATSLRAALGDTPEVGTILSPAELDAAFDMSTYTRHVDALFSRAGLD
jgi:adenylosuccinate lyase